MSHSSPAYLTVGPPPWSIVRSARPGRLGVAGNRLLARHAVDHGDTAWGALTGECAYQDNDRCGANRADEVKGERAPKYSDAYQHTQAGQRQQGDQRHPKPERRWQ
jgi:hypothetical protein